MKKILIAALAAFTALSGILPVSAAPLTATPPQMILKNDVMSAQYREDRRERREWERDRRPEFRHPPPRRGWHNGHQGYRDQRRGYRRHSDGWWYPLAAFGAGAIIGGAINSQPAYREPGAGINPRHVDWCSARYRSYRAYDNTYAPQVGVRAQCVSPYY